MFLRESFEYSVKCQHASDYQHYVAMSASVFHDSSRCCTTASNREVRSQRKGNDDFQKGNKLFRRKSRRHFEK